MYFLMSLVIVNVSFALIYIKEFGDGPTDSHVETCDGNDRRISCEDIGNGRNHGCDYFGENGCRAWEGEDNYGSGGCRLTCEKTIGCFDKSGNNQPSGSLTPANFGYYIDDGGNQQNDPDNSGGACACIAGTSYNTQCCGDDTSDCGAIFTGGNLCSIDQTSSSTLVSSSSNVGNIIYVGCNNKEYLSDGSTWKICDGTFWSQTVGSNEYICTNSGIESIAECCGDGTCNSRTDGKRLSTGQSVSVTTSKSTTTLTDYVVLDKESLEKISENPKFTKLDNTYSTFKSISPFLSSIKEENEIDIKNGVSLQSAGSGIFNQITGRFLGIGQDQTCSDGTYHGTCSQTKPLYCLDGILRPRCDICGCLSGQTCQGDGSCLASVTSPIPTPLPSSP
ncbi:hypothetical protein HYW99_01515, partial [Candidatus Woesearchaeota archaeon]|nr:hypothetical protein [Candidatus Woesearchaeota archaeon]